MRQLPLLLILPLVVASGCIKRTASQVKPEEIQQAAAELGKATLGGKYETIADMTYSGMIDLVGGRQRMIEMLEASAHSDAAMHQQILGFEPDLPAKIVDVDTDIVAVVTDTRRFRSRNRKFSTKSYMVAISTDGARHWTFFDPADDARRLKFVYPKFPDSLDLPHKSEPVVEPN